MNVADMFPSKYLAAQDLPGRVEAKVEKIIPEQVGENPPEIKYVIYFVGKTKGMVINKTKGQTLAMIYGDDTDKWIGQDLQLEPGITTYMGKPVKCVNIVMPASMAMDFNQDSENPAPAANEYGTEVATPAAEGDGW